MADKIAALAAFVDGTAHDVLGRAVMANHIERRRGKILDLVAENSRAGLSRDEILRDWQQLGDIEAVRTGRVYLVDDDYAFIPGPRFIMLVEKFARLIHPEQGAMRH